MVGLFQSVVKDYGQHTALAVKRAGEWRTWTYDAYYKDAQLIAKALIQVRNPFSLLSPSPLSFLSPSLLHLPSLLSLPPTSPLPPPPPTPHNTHSPVKLATEDPLF